MDAATRPQNPSLVNMRCMADSEMMSDQNGPDNQNDGSGGGATSDPQTSFNEMSLSDIISMTSGRQRTDEELKMEYTPLQIQKF